MIENMSDFQSKFLNIMKSFLILKNNFPFFGKNLKTLLTSRKSNGRILNCIIIAQIVRIYLFQVEKLGE